MICLLKLKKTLENSPIGLGGYAKLLDVSKKTLYNKLTGATPFSYPEYLKLKELLPEYNIDYLLTRMSEDGSGFEKDARDSA